MKTYWGNGILEDIPYFLNCDMEFGIQEINEAPSFDRYTYPNDSIRYDLDDVLVELYDVFRDSLFDDMNRYYLELSTAPIWMQSAGQDTDCVIGSDLFKKWVLEVNNESSYRLMYLVDCQYLIGTIQNLLCAMENAFVNYYKTIAEIPCDSRYMDCNESKVIFTSSSAVIDAISFIETYFTKAYSILDMASKICYELEHLRSEFDTYHKLKCEDILWGNRKHLKIKNTPNTIFEDCELIRNIESIRNETVHNGTWELRPKLFIKIDAGKVIEKFMLFPDMVQGRLAKVKGRRHFFSQNVKVNDVLPKVHLEFQQRLLETVHEIKNIYLRR